MTSDQALALRNLVIASRKLLDSAVELLEKAEDALAEHVPGGDVQKQREAEREDYWREK